MSLKKSIGYPQLILIFFYPLDRLIRYEMQSPWIQNKYWWTQKTCMHSQSYYEKRNRGKIDATYIKVLGALDAITFINLQNFGKCHQECYKLVTNETNIDRLIERYKKRQTCCKILTFQNVKSGKPSKESMHDTSQNQWWKTLEKYEFY